MVKTLLGAAAMAAVAYAFVPAHAARVGVGCSGDNLAKTEGAVENMADGPPKFAAQREIAAAQDAMLKGSMGGCAMHLTRAMDASTMAPTSYPEGTMAQFPGQAPPGQTVGEAPSQPRSGRRAVQAPQ